MRNIAFTWTVIHPSPGTVSFLLYTPVKARPQIPNAWINCPTRLAKLRFDCRLRLKTENLSRWRIHCMNGKFAKSEISLL